MRTTGHGLELIAYEQPHHRGGHATEVAHGFSTRCHRARAPSRDANPDRQRGCSWRTVRRRNGDRRRCAFRDRQEGIGQRRLAACATPAERHVALELSIARDCRSPKAASASSTRFPHPDWLNLLRRARLRTARTPLADLSVQPCQASTQRARRLLVDLLVHHRLHIRLHGQGQNGTSSYSTARGS